MSSQQQDGAGWKEQLKAIGNLIVESQGMDEGGDEMVGVWGCSVVCVYASVS